jgi:hypothetical protein
VSLQAKAVEDALANERHSLVACHSGPRVERFVFIEARHRDGPLPARTVFDLAHAAF